MKATRALCGILAAAVVGLSVGSCASYTASPSRARESRDEALARLASESGVDWMIPRGRYLMPQGLPVTPGAGGSVTRASGASPQDVATSFLSRFGALFDIRDVDSELRLVLNVELDDVHFVRFDQFEGDVPVENAGILVALDASYSVLFIWNAFVPDLHETSTSPGLTGAQARAIARADMERRVPATAGQAPEDTGLPRLVFYPTDPDLASAALAYRVDLSYVLPSSEMVSWTYVVDAGAVRRGAILLTANAMTHIINPPPPPAFKGICPYINVNAPGCIVGSAFGIRVQYGGGHPQCLTHPNAPCRYDFMQALQPCTQNACVPPQYAWNYPTDVEITVPPQPNCATGTKPIFPFSDCEADEAYYNLGRAGEFWNFALASSFGFDGHNTPLNIGVHADAAFGGGYNAAWDPVHHGILITDAPIDAYGVTPLPFSGAEDAMAHEYWHGIAQFTYPLLPSPIGGPPAESAVLSESLGDVFGNLVENEFPPVDYAASIETENEEVAGPSGNPFLRNLHHPHQSGCPACPGGEWLPS